MKIIEPKVELWQQGDNAKAHVARCARVCYGRETGNICQHAIKELKLAGYGKGEGGPDDWMYQQVIEAVAVFASHGNSGGSAPWEINLVQKLCDWDIISPLRFTELSFCL